MKGLSKVINVIFLGGFLGAVAMTWLAPKIIEMFLTPPVSFGVNCEPAAVYSMQKLILCQIIGIIFGSLLFLILKMKFFNNTKEDKNAINSQSNSPQSPNR